MLNYYVYLLILFSSKILIYISNYRMSSRVIRKLRNENQSSEAHIAPISSESDENNEEECEEKKISCKFNVFSLLEDEAGDSAEVAEEESDDAGCSSAMPPPLHANANKAANKKSKSKKKKSKPEQCSSEFAEGNFPERKPKKVVEAKSALWIDVRFFNAEYEMKCLTSTSAKPSISGNRNKKVPAHLKKSRIVQPKGSWPPLVRLGFSMDKNEDGTFYLKYSPNYEAVQQLFEMAVHQLLVDQIQRILMENPYHLEALLQMSEMEHMQESYGTAADLVERVLYAVEAVSHPSFNWSTGVCKMKYTVKENRPLFVALFRRVGFLSHRSCYRCALEFSKALLSLNVVDDPLCSVLFMDLFSLECHLYDWLLQFVQEFGIVRRLRLFPSLAYSSALALYHLAAASPDDDTGSEKANKKLQEALLRFPGVLIPLLDALTVEPDEVIKKCSYFNSHSIASESLGLPHLQKLYVSMAHHLWKDVKVIDWLVSNAHTVLQRVPNEEAVVKTYQLERQQNYKEIPIQLKRHLFLLKSCGFTVDVISDRRSEEVLSFDPFPPPGAESQRFSRTRLSDNTALNFIMSFFPNFDPQNPPQYNSLMELIQDFLHLNQPQP